MKLFRWHRGSAPAQAPESLPQARPTTPFVRPEQTSIACRLPFEIYLHIAADSSKPDVLALLMTCRVMQTAMEQQLYKCINLRTGRNNRNAIVKLLWTLTIRPDLAACITSFEGHLTPDPEDYAYKLVNIPGRRGDRSRAMRWLRWDKPRRLRPKRLTQTVEEYELLLSTVLSNATNLRALSTYDLLLEGRWFGNYRIIQTSVLPHVTLTRHKTRDLGRWLRFLAGSSDRAMVRRKARHSGLSATPVVHRRPYAPQLHRPPSWRGAGDGLAWSQEAQGRSDEREDTGSRAAGDDTRVDGCSDCARRRQRLGCVRGIQLPCHQTIDLALIGCRGCHGESTGIDDEDGPYRGIELCAPRTKSEQLCECLQLLWCVRRVPDLDLKVLDEAPLLRCIPRVYVEGRLIDWDFPEQYLPRWEYVSGNSAGSATPTTETSIGDLPAF